MPMQSISTPKQSCARAAGTTLVSASCHPILCRAPYRAPRVPWAPARRPVVPTVCVYFSRMAGKRIESRLPCMGTGPRLRGPRGRRIPARQRRPPRRSARFLLSAHDRKEPHAKRQRRRPQRDDHHRRTGPQRAQAARQLQRRVAIHRRCTAFRASNPVPNGEPVIFEADYPPSMGGTGVAPNPLAYCFWGGMPCYAMTYAQEAARQGIELRTLRARTEAQVDMTRALGVTPTTRPCNTSTGTWKATPRAARDARRAQTHRRRTLPQRLLPAQPERARHPPRHMNAPPRPARGL